MKQLDPWRYYMGTRPISFRESVRRFLRTWKWHRDEIYMRPVKKDEVGYDEAPFEASIVYHKDVMDIPANDHAS